MRKFVLFVICTTILFSCKEKAQEKKEEKIETDTVELTEAMNNCNKKKFRLCKEENYFKISEKYIKLKIPVTDNKLKYAETRNISSDNLNAILIHFFGGPDCTPNTGKIYKKNINPIKYSDLGITQTQLKDSLLVAIFVNDELLTRDDVDIYKKLVQDSKSYRDAAEKLRDSSECYKESVDPQEEGSVQPREDDGDVIGGNG